MDFNDGRPVRPMDIAVIGSGISGMSAAWLLSQRHRVTVYEADERLGGHSHTVEAPGETGPVPVDMGFIVYNRRNYPNLTALFRHLGVRTRWSDMSFAVSLDQGGLEYGSTSPWSLFAQARNLSSPRFWGMLGDILRFYREAPGHCAADAGALHTIGDYLDAHGYGAAFQDDHLLPQAAAIWSCSLDTIRDYPAEAFIRFCENHGLLRVFTRPIWRSVEGGSREYVKRLTESYADRVKLNCAARALRRDPDGVQVLDADGRLRRFDHVVVAAHADQALAMLSDPSREERELLGAFPYTKNLAVMHTDASLMPRRRTVWSSWNYIGEGGGAQRRLCVTYWMNRLQKLNTRRPIFVTLNPVRAPAPGALIRSEVFEHPLFDSGALAAQKRLWSLQGVRRTWFCGAWFGSGFHEDGLQSGLAVAEALGGVRRPWTVAGESGRIHIGPLPSPEPTLEIAA